MALDLVTQVWKNYLIFDKVRKIKNIEKVTSIYHNWIPSDLAFIKNIEWNAKNLIIIFYCQLRSGMIGWPDISKDFFEISITFENVSNFKLEFTNPGIHQVSGFDIIDISNNGLEDVNFQIEDYENGSICFNCKDININSISRLILISFEE